MKPIVHVPHDVLNTPAKTVTTFDKKLSNLVTDMIKTLRATKRPKGVGLAAPQIGESYRVFITKPSAKSEIRVFINPEIIGFSNDTSDKSTVLEEDKKLEGCLSIPDIWGHVTRSNSVTLKFQDMDGTAHEEIITGFMATIVQHETDHTNGILFSQRVVEQHGKFFQTMTDKDGKEILEEISIG